MKIIDFRVRIAALPRGLCEKTTNDSGADYTVTVVFLSTPRASFSGFSTFCSERDAPNGWSGHAVWCTRVVGVVVGYPVYGVVRGRAWDAPPPWYGSGATPYTVSSTVSHCGTV